MIARTRTSDCSHKARCTFTRHPHFRSHKDAGPPALPGTYPPCSQKECMHSLLVLSHSLTVLSSLADTINRPSGENLRQEL